MVTKGFKEALAHLKDGQEKIVFRGPKGVGKSMALCAIAFLCKERKYPCLLYALESSPTQFVPYVQAIYQSFGEHILHASIVHVF